MPDTNPLPKSWKEPECKLPDNVRQSPYCPFLSEEEALYHAWVTLCPELSAEKLELLETFLCAPGFDLDKFRAAIHGTHHRAFVIRVEKRLPLLALESNSVPHTTVKHKGTDREGLETIVTTSKKVMMDDNDDYA